MAKRKANPMLQFNYWKRHLDSFTHTLAPVKGNDISAATIFLWISESYQMGPCIGGGAFWMWLPDARSAAGYLRHCYLPHCFSDWLVRTEWDPDPEAARSAEEIFDLAEKADACRYKRNIPEMKEVTAILDSAMAKKNEKSCLAEIRRALPTFKKSGIGDGCMSFSIDLVGHLPEMSDKVLDRLSQEGDDEDAENRTREWKQLTQPGALDGAKSDRIRDVLEELTVF